MLCAAISLPLKAQPLANSRGCATSSIHRRDMSAGRNRLRCAVVDDASIHRRDMSAGRNKIHNTVIMPSSIHRRDMSAGRNDLFPDLSPDL